jgi:SAM-dependent methyltransferase
MNDIFFKYGWTHRQLEAGLSILDIGCGQDQPLLYVMGARKDMVPNCYLGVDLNRIMKKSHVRWAEVWDEFDFVNNWQKVLTKYTPFDVAVCFEVIEHMAAEDGCRLLSAIFGCLRPGGVAYLSTPVFNGLAAANHIHEWTIAPLQLAIEGAGFRVERRIGTFASKPDIKAACLSDGDKGLRRWETYQELETWFGGDVMSAFMAPLYPNHSRNNLWVLAKPTE